MILNDLIILAYDKEIYMNWNANEFKTYLLIIFIDFIRLLLLETYCTEKLKS